MARMSFSISVGGELELPDSYVADREWRRYWRVSFKGGAEYKIAEDQDGEALLVQHESETDKGYKRRRTTTTPRNYCAPILRRYNDFVFRREPTVPGRNIEWYANWLGDCDGHGTTALDFWRQRLLAAQVDRESHILCTRTGPADGSPMSRLQAESQGVRPAVQAIDTDAVIYSEMAGNAVRRAVVLMELDDGANVARDYGPEAYIDYIIEWDKARKRWMVVDALDPVAHGYPLCPVQALCPLFDDFGEGKSQSQCGPLADAQRSVYNLLSLLSEELYQNTYTQWVLRGVTAQDVKDGAAQMGAKRMLCVPNPGAGLDRIGSDVAQAQSIRTSISDEEANIYRMAGVSAADPTQAGAPESGIAKAFRFNDLAANLSALADAVEASWNNCVWILSQAFSLEYPGDIKMPDDFVPPDMTQELIELIQALPQRDIPKVIKDHMLRRFADRNLSLSEEEEDMLEAELAAGPSASLITPGQRSPLDSEQPAPS